MSQCLLTLVVVALLAAGPAIAKERTWTSSDGRQMKAEFVRLIDGEVTFLKDGKLVTVPMERLSERDQQIVRDLAAGKPVPDEPVSNQPNVPDPFGSPSPAPSARDPGAAGRATTPAAPPARSDGRITIENRPWIYDNNKQTTARFVRVNGNDVVLNRAGKVLTIPFFSLSEADQDYVRQVLKQQDKEHLVPKQPAGATGQAVGAAATGAAPGGVGIPDSTGIVPPGSIPPRGLGPGSLGPGAMGPGAMGPGAMGPGAMGPGATGPSGIGRGPGGIGPGGFGPGMAGPIGKGPGMGPDLGPGMGPGMGPRGPGGIGPGMAGMGGVPGAGGMPGPKGMGPGSTASGMPGMSGGPGATPGAPTMPPGIAGMPGGIPAGAPEAGSPSGGYPRTGERFGPGFESGFPSAPAVADSPSAGPSPFTSSLPSAPIEQVYECSGCKRQISQEQAKGTKCPYCGIYWLYKENAGGGKTYHGVAGAFSGGRSAGAMVAGVIAALVVVLLIVAGGAIAIIAAIVKAAAKPSRPLGYSSYRRG
jgi:DNA-directed RNA polymerase subunit RPC12/RpoP